jgi:hypothetical protein
MDFSAKGGYTAQLQGLDRGLGNPHFYRSARKHDQFHEKGFFLGKHSWIS